ncbi:mucin-5AC isoform X6 [Dendroctonus ponderosae]|uniref:mucin-5AC isoform X6 n=1 Tax=Dendroctonus ponderosae TaxID=77166 RepID=UPI002034BD0C|nr:mucin-5AC isoform X6 [Dendroctonus ponderosae]
MNFLFFLLLALCLVEIHSQRSRTSNTNEEPAPSRTRGRARFSAAEVLAEQSTPATANRRASTRTRIHSNNPQAAAERRARPTEAPRSYEVEEINNDSPIDSFRRQSKSRVLTESRFEAPSRRPAIEVSSAAVTPAVADILPVDELGFGSTARAILQARGQTLPPKTTTPVVDEEYLLTNFGSTIRSLAAASRSAQASFAGKSNIPQRATVLRSEAPILTREDLRSSAPVPSVRASPERLAPSRSRPGSRAKPVEVRPAVEENVRAPAEEPEPVQGLSEAAELVTETQPLEISSEAQHLLEGAGGVFSEETSTLKSTTAQPNRVVSKGRRPSPRPSVVEYSPAPRLRSRVTTNRRPAQPSGETSSSRPRFSRRKLEDSIEAESSFRGPAVATVEQFEAATSRSRPGRKIDSKFERVPVDLTPESTTVRSRSSGRRATTSDPSSVERSNVGEKASRGRARSRTETPTASTSRSAGRRAEQRRPTETPNSKPSSSRRRGGSEEGSRRATNEDRSSRERSTTRREGSLVEAPARRKGGQSRFATQPQEAPSSRSRNPARLEESVEDTTVFYGEKSRSTDAPETSSSTTTTAKSAVERKPLKESFRSRSRFPISPPIIDETKLEVLPLFEREPKSLVSTRSRGRGRSSVSRRSSVDHMHVSATENDVKFVEKPTTSAFSRVTVTRAEPVEASTGRARLSTRVTSSTEAPKSSSPTPETTTRAKTSPRIKESVVSEVNQVISKSTITRRKKVSKAKAAEMLSRGNKKAELNPQEKSRSSEEDVGEEDNYPEPFKALIQAKKSKGEVRPTKPSLKSFTVTPKTSTTEKLVVTSTVSPRSSPSSARAITGIPKRSQDINEIINDNDNELDPKPKQPSTTSTTPRPTRPRQLPKFSEKNAKSRLSTKPTSASRKSYAPRNAVDHQVRRKTLRSTASPPPTTPLSVVTKETKFSAKFVKKETDGLSNGKTVGGPQPKGLYSSKRVDKEVEAIGVAQSPKPVQPIKKFNTSRYSSRYRLDTSSRSSVLKSTTSAPFYIPTIPTPAYVPTVPTLRPPVTPVDGVVAVTDDDLGVEVISFDDPVNSIASADLVNGEFLTTDKNLKLTATAKDGTTEKAVSIIERIINSITMISTTEAPNTSTSNLPPSSPNAASENSAILKLATKKTTPKDKTTPDIQTNIIETITSEKPTTIIEKIRSSLTAIQTNEVESNRMSRLLATEQQPTSTSIVTVSAPSTTTLAPLTTASTTVSTSTVLPSTSTMQTASTTVEPGVVRIMAIPGEMRISKALETTTQAESSTTQPSTMATSTMWQSTETIPPTLGEILNGRTVDALNNLIKLDATSTTTQVPNFKTLQVNQYNEVLNIQDLINRNNGNVIYRWKPVTKAEYKSIKNSLALSTAEPSTVTTLQTSETMAPFTSPILSTEKTTFVPTTDDLLFTSTLMSTLAPASTTTPEPTTQSSTTTTSTTTTTTTTTTTPRPTTTTTTTTTTQRPTTTKRVETTTRKLMSTTGFPSFTPSGILPTFLTTLFPNLIRGTISPQENSRPVDVSNSLSDRFEVLAAAGTTARPTVILSQSPSTQRISTTTPTTTTTTSTTTTTTTTQAPPPTTETPTTTTPKPKPASTKEDTDKLFEELKKSGKLNNLNEEQKRNLAEIEKIEKEQAALLKQLSLLTTMFAPPNVRAPTLSPMPNPLSASSSSLANRVIAMAMERDRSRSMTTTQEPQTTTKRRPNSIQDQLPITHVEDATKKTTPSLEDILKQYNLDGLSTPAPLTSTYGKTDEALLAAILKEHGIGPTTPKILGERVKEAGIFEEAPTTKKPKPKSRPIATTSRPVGGRLMQGLNWLLDILDPPTTKKPTARKAPSKPAASKPNAADDEILSNQPTRITPMVTAAPVTKPSLTQDEIQGLIKQLEAVQNDPDAADQLDFSKIKSLQNLINVNEGVQVTHTGQHGATSRATPRPPRVRSSTEKDRLLAEINRRPKASTISTLSVSNSIDDDDEDEDASSISTTTRTRVMPPVSLNPIPGIDDQGDSMIRSNLLTAAVNVTRAISSFLGSAIQDAAQQVRSAFYTGSSGVLGGLSSGSNLSSIAGASFG